MHSVPSGGVMQSIISFYASSSVACSKAAPTSGASKGTVPMYFDGTLSVLRSALPGTSEKSRSACASCLDYF